MGADSSDKIPQMPLWILTLNLHAQVQKFGIFEKSSLWVFIVRGFIDCDAVVHLNIQNVDEIAFLFEL